MKKLFWVLVVFGMVAPPIGAADWSVYTNVQQYRRLYADSHYVYAATSGGLYRREAGGGGPVIFNSGDGLGANDVQTAAFDADTLWLGGNGAILTRFVPATRAAARFPLALGVGAVRSLALCGDSLWVGTDIGVGLFIPDLLGGVFTEVYTRLGTLPAEAAVIDQVILNDRLYVATEFGIASARCADPTLYLPQNWTTFADPDQALTRTHQLAEMFDSVWAGTDLGLYVLEDTAFVPRFTARSIRSLFAGVDTLWMGTDSGIYYRTRDSVYRLHATNLDTFAIETIARAPGGDLWVGFNGASLWHLGADDSVFKDVVVNQPKGSVAAGIAESEGRVWCAFLGQGAGYLDIDGEWRAISGITASAGAPLYSAVATPSVTYYPGWGQGLISVVPAGGSVVVSQFDAANSLLEPVTGSDTYTVVADVEVDAAGGRWVANRKTRAPTLRSLVYFPPLDTPQVAFDAADGIDNDMTVTLLVGNRLWIGYNGRGLGVLDFKGTPAFKGDDSIALFTVTSDRLPSDFITALELDRAGYIWVGTPGGLARIDPQFYPFLVVEPAELEPAGTEVLALVADAGNQLWVGTGHGLARIPDGALKADSFWFAGPTPLPDNRVRSLAFDSAAARLWIGTDNGVARLPLLARPAVSEQEGLGIFPSPLVLRTSGDIATFEVPFGARIDIFSVAGERVRSLATGNTWDGRNESGTFVATGLYLIRVTYADGTHRSGRLGVIRER